MNRKSLLWAAAAAGVLAVGVALVLAGGAPRTLRLGHDLGAPAVVAAVDREVANFQSLYPQIRVELVPGASDPAQVDLAVLGQYPAEPRAWVEPLTTWSGALWVLAARRDLVDRLQTDDPRGVGALRSGTLTPQGFEALMARVKAGGTTPLTLGNRNLWPYLLWLQAWTASTLGPGAAQEVPGVPPEGPRSDLERWRRLGWFETSAWDQGWARGLAPLETGRAGFALVSEPLVSALSPATRTALEFFPLPKRAEDPPWNLGRAQILGISARTTHRDEALLLVRFLTSPGVTARLVQATGRPFFAWTQAAEKPPVWVPDWAARMQDPGVFRLAQDLARTPSP